MSKSAEKVAQLTQENEVLRARLRELREALDSVNFGVCMYDADRRLVLCNKRYPEVLKLPPEEFRPGARHVDLIRHGVEAGHYPPELSAEDLEELVWENFRSDDGSRKPLERAGRIFSVYSRRTENGGIACTFEDITARTEAEAALLASEARLSAVLEAMPECVKIFGENGELLYINPKGLELIQAPDLETFMASGHKALPEEHYQRALEVHGRVISGDSVNWSYELIGMEGRRSHVEANAVPVILPDGTKAHLSISRDISERQKAENALRASEERLRLVHEATGLADFQSLPGGTAVFGPAFAAQCGLPRDTTTLTFEEWMELIHPDDRDDLAVMIGESLAKEDVFEAEFRIVRPDNGETRWISTSARLKRDEHGEVLCGLGAHLDITERKRSEAALRESEERFRLASEAAGLGVWDYDPVSGKREWSDRLIEILGLPRDCTPSPGLAAERVHPADRTGFLEDLHALKESEGSARIASSFRIIRSEDREERWVSINGWRTGAAGGQSRIILTVRDVTDERTAEERIRWNATHDALTQLANRASFQERLGSTIRAAKRNGGNVGLLMIDLDHFKQVNDALGHDAGDRLLQEFAVRLKSAVRSTDTVARLSGDEFAVLVPRLAKADDLIELSRSIHDRLREPFLQKGRVLDCRISVGAAVYPQHAKTPKDLMVSADMALYAAKHAGRSTTVEYQPHLREDVQRLAAMVRTARDAVQNDRIVPYYQPQLNLQDGSIAGFEALLRWRDSKGRVHLPATIEAAFEDHEVAAAISDRMIEQAIADMRGWLDKGVAFGHVAVNASAAEFRRDDFGERVLELLRKSDIAPEHFQLEVTETVFLGRGSEYVQRALSLLSSMGVKIALDDFGTGYASLRHLKQFPVDVLKIDQSFVRDMQEDPGDEAIIRAVINLGRNLGIKVVAEGIERLSQAERLIELGCDYGQGFLFSKALPASRIPALVQHLPGRVQHDRQPVTARELRLVSGGN